MAYTNSKLVDYTRISPNRTKSRKNQITKITIHHMAGNLSIESCGAHFANAKARVSSNYGIGSDGRIGLYVEEKDRSWCSSSAINDNCAITIEVANCGRAPEWKVSDKALAALIELCTDICKRNGIKKLVFTGDASGNLTLHKFFKATECPGKYLESKIPYIVKEVNERLNPTAFKPYTVKVVADTLNVRAGAGTGYAVKTTINKDEVYTIIQEKEVGGLLWGKLKSGAGWISLRHTKKQS